MERQVMTSAPRHVCIAGALMIAVGINAIARMIAGVVSGDFQFDLGFIAIPIGYGLLVGRASSRRWALLLAAIGFLFIAGLLGWTAYQRFAEMDELWLENAVLPTNYIVGGVMAFGLACIYIFVILWRPQNRQWFLSENTNPSDAKNLAWSVAVIALGYCVILYVWMWGTEATLDQIYPVRTQITVVDEQTGEGIGSALLHNDDLWEKGDKGKALPRLESLMDVRSNSSMFTISGIAKRPFEVTISADGFQDRTITLNKRTPPEMEVELSRSK